MISGWQDEIRKIPGPLTRGARQRRLQRIEVTTKMLQCARAAACELKIVQFHTNLMKLIKLIGNA